MAMKMNSKKRRREFREQQSTTSDKKVENKNNPENSRDDQDENRNNYGDEDNLMMLISNTSTSGAALYSNGIQGVYHRIRTPHEHDVLSGRGGGINAHLGNVQFREWVRVRKNDYNLAPSKVEKARVAQEVIDLVRNQKPPGRFLQKDPTSGGMMGGWWVEIDEERVLAKTSQALREGAPQIRAAHQSDSPKSKLGRKQVIHPTATPSMPVPSATTSNAAVSTKIHGSTSIGFSHITPIAPTSSNVLKKRAIEDESNGLLEQEALRQLKTNAMSVQYHQTENPSNPGEFPSDPEGFSMDNVGFHRQHGVAIVKDEDPPVESSTVQERPPSKRVRLEYNGHTVLPTDETPPLNGISEHPVFGIPPPFDLSSMDQKTNHLPRTNSLALPEFRPGVEEEWSNETFVNPFEEESFLDSAYPVVSFPFPDEKVVLGRESWDKTPVELGTLKPGIFHRESSSASDMAGLGALLKDNNSPEEDNNEECKNCTSMLVSDYQNEVGDSYQMSALVECDDYLVDPLLSLDDIYKDGGRDFSAPQ